MTVSYRMETVVNPAPQPLAILMNGAALDPNNINETPAETQGQAITPVVFQAVGGTPPYSFGSLTGTLPTGVQVNPTGADNVTLEGTPANTGTFDWGISVSDAAGNVAQVSGTMKTQASAAPPDVAGTITKA